MTYEEAKIKQIEEFKKGNYLVLREQSGDFHLIQAASRQVAQESLAKDVIAEIRRLPTRLRVLPGGKN